MERNTGSENPNLSSDVTTGTILDDDSFDNDKTVGYPSSSSSFSSSSHLEIDIGEYDMTFPEFEENDSSIERSNPESPTGIIASPLAPGVSLSPKQSPRIQVMGNDTNKIPSPVFGRKRRNDSEWSLASNESLFSIHMGNNGFSMDSGFYLSQAGELNWLDDELNYSCFTPDDSKLPVLQTVTETAESKPKSASTNRESGEKEEFLETQNDSTRNSANIACYLMRVANAIVHLHSLCGSPSSSPTKIEAEKPQSPPSTPPVEASQTTPKAPSTTPNAGGNQWFHCFSCFPMCCCCINHKNTRKTVTPFNEKTQLFSRSHQSKKSDPALYRCQQNEMNFMGGI